MTQIQVLAWPAGPVQVRIQGEPPDALASPEVEREWARQCALNPRLHDGPVLAVRDLDAPRGVVTCVRSTYKRFVAGPAAERVEALGVTGVCLRAGEAEVLLGRRAPGVRIYGGMWETAPRGGVALDAARRELGLDDLAACLREEAREELGHTATLEAHAVFAAVRDPVASSLDLCVRCTLDDRGEAGSWEYADRRWVRLDELRRWARGGMPPSGVEGELSPPCAALLAAWAGLSAGARTPPCTP